MSIMNAWMKKKQTDTLSNIDDVPNVSLCLGLQDRPSKNLVPMVLEMVSIVDNVGVYIYLVAKKVDGGVTSSTDNNHQTKQ